MFEFLLGLFTGVMFFIYYRYISKRELKNNEKKSYFNGWMDRHQGKPLLPRYWLNIRLGNYNEPLDQMIIRQLQSKESYETRLEAGLPPYDLNLPYMNYALSNDELRLLEQPKERIWRGISTQEEEENWDESDVRETPSRFPDYPEVEDVMVLEMLFEINDIAKYYRVLGLDISRDRRGRIIRVKSKR